MNKKPVLRPTWTSFQNHSNSFSSSLDSVHLKVKWFNISAYQHAILFVDAIQILIPVTTLKPYLLISYQYPREYQFLGSIQNPARTSHFLEVTPIVAHYKPGIVPCRTVFFNGGARWDHDLHVMSLNHAQQKWTETRTLTHTFSIAFWLAMEISNWDASFFFLSMAEIDFGNSWLMMCRFAASFVGFLSHLSMTSRFNIKVRLYLISWFKHFVVLQLDR
jgi:hypothetical protein